MKLAFTSLPPHAEYAIDCKNSMVDYLYLHPLHMAAREDSPDPDHVSAKWLYTFCCETRRIDLLGFVLIVGLQTGGGES